MHYVSLIKNGNVNAIKKLLNNGNNVNQMVNEKYTPLFVASGVGRIEIVRLLLAKGANANKGSVLGETPIFIASKNGCTEVVKLLLGAPGIDVNLADKTGEAPLHLASNNGHKEVVKLLLGAPGIKVNLADNRYRNTPLHLASSNGHKEVVKLLLGAPGIKVNLGERDWATPLKYASQFGCTEVVKLLLDAPGIDVNKATIYGKTPLHYALAMGRPEVVKLLLDAPGIDVNKADKDGRTPLYQASTSHQAGPYNSPLGTKLVKLLLAAPGIDVNKANKNGDTPLIFASRYGYIKVVKLLLNKGADPFKKNKDDKTALDVTKKTAIKKLLRKAMGTNTPWRNMNANQKKTFKPILLQRMVAKNASNKTFTDPILQVNFSLNTLEPLNKGDNRLGGLGLVIDDRNRPIRFVNAPTLRYSIGSSRNNTVRGVFHKNWSLINVTAREYQNARKGMEKLSARAKGARTRKNLKRRRTNRIEANQRKKRTKL
jgi:ankyrin repeat protein